MNNNFRTIGAHWYSRKENLKESTQHLLNFLLALKEHNIELFSEWHEKGNSKKEALSGKVNIEYERLKKLLSKKGKDEDYPDFSFRLSLWNGKENDGESAALSVSLGSEESKNFTNNCIIKMPYEGKQFEF